MDMQNLEMNVQNDYHLYLYYFVNIGFHVQYNIYFHLLELSFSKYMPSSSDRSDELVGVCEVSSSSSMPTNAFFSSNCNPTSPWLWVMLLVCLCVVSSATFGIVLLLVSWFCCFQRESVAAHLILVESVIRCITWDSRWKCYSFIYFWKK